MILLNAILLGGLAVTGIPLVIHLMHRRQAKSMSWGAMQFLQLMMAKSRRWLLIEQLLLLAIRMALLAAFAFALTRPASVPSDQGQDRIVRHGRTAAVICIDDSQSLNIKGRRERVIALARSYLGTLSAGDEIVVLFGSTSQDFLPEPLRDPQLALRHIEALRPQSQASDHLKLLSAGLRHFAVLSNPNTELVLISDGFDDGYNSQDAERWATLRGHLCSDPKAARGTRQNIRLMLLHPEAETPLNLAVTSLEAVQEVVPVNARGEVRASLFASGLPVTGRNVLVRLYADERSCQEKTLRLHNGSTPLVLPLPVMEAGLHAVEVRIEDAQDDAPQDDRRHVIVQTAKDFPVLLIDAPGQDTGRLKGLSFASYALRPDTQGFFSPRRLASDQVEEQDLFQARVVILDGPPPLGHRLCAALERFVAGGGGLFICLGDGPGTNSALKSLWQDGQGILPLYAKAPTDLPSPCGLRIVMGHHPVLAPFVQNQNTGLPLAQVHRLWSLDLKQTSRSATQTQVLFATPQGAPALVTARVGRGQVAVLALPLDVSWSLMASDPAFVPLIRRLCLYLSGNLVPPRNLSTGGRLVLPLSASASTATARTQTGQVLPLTAGYWMDQAAMVSPPLDEAGLIYVSGRPGTPPEPFAVGLPAIESQCATISGASIQRLESLGSYRFTTHSAIESNLGLAPVSASEWWRSLIGFCLLLMLVEIWYTGRMLGREGAGGRN